MPRTRYNGDMKPLPPPTFSLKIADLKRPGTVYAWKRGEEWLYVGFSHNPFARIQNHSTVGRVVAFEPTDDILVWVFESSKEGRLWEARLIREHRPKFNIQHNDVARTVECLKCRRPFQQTRWWQKFCSPDCRKAGKSKAECEAPKVDLSYMRPTSSEFFALENGWGRG